MRFTAASTFWGLGPLWILQPCVPGQASGHTLSQWASMKALAGLSCGGRVSLRISHFQGVGEADRVGSASSASRTWHKGPFLWQPEERRPQGREPQGAPGSRSRGARRAREGGASPARVTPRDRQLWGLLPHPHPTPESQVAPDTQLLLPPVTP